MMDRFHRPESSYLPLRIYLCLRTIIVAVVSLGIPGGLNGRLIAQGGAVAYAVVAFMVFCAVVGLLDAIINDILPDRYALPWARNHRHFGYIGLSMGGCVFLFVMARNEAITLLALSYAVDALFAAGVAVGSILRNQRSRRYPYIDRRQARA